MIVSAGLPASFGFLLPGRVSVFLASAILSIGCHFRRSPVARKWNCPKVFVRCSLSAGVSERFVPKEIVQMNLFEHIYSNEFIWNKFVGTNSPERLCPNDFFRTIFFERNCPKLFVRNNLRIVSELGPLLRPLTISGFTFIFYPYCIILQQ